MDFSSNTHKPKSIASHKREEREIYMKLIKKIKTQNQTTKKNSKLV